MGDIRQIELYLDAKDSLALRYLMEYEHIIHHDGAPAVDEATEGVVRCAIRKFWGALEDLELFSKYDAAVVIRNEDGTQREFDWDTVCDSDDYATPSEPNTAIKVSQEVFILLEASLRRTAWYVTNGRYPERDELLRIALRFRALTIRLWNKREESKKEFGINTPNGLVPMF